MIQSMGRHIGAHRLGCSTYDVAAELPHASICCACVLMRCALQEIYGITEANNARSTSANVDDDFGAYCVVCLSNRKNTTVLPCRHFCMCDDCAKLLLKRTRTCPMCRLPITSVLNIQIRQGSGGGGGGGAAITGPAAAGSGGGAAVAAAAEPTTAAAS